MPPISEERLEELEKKLAAMPAYVDKARIVSKREAIAKLAGQIDAMKQRGYPIERIVEMLRDGGIELSAPSLRAYLRDVRPQSASSQAAKPAKKPRNKTVATT